GQRDQRAAAHRVVRDNGNHLAVVVAQGPGDLAGRQHQATRGVQMISIVLPGGVSLMARSTLSASSMSMYRARGMPSREIVSWRWIRVITVASRRTAIRARRRRRLSAIIALWMTG